MRKCTLAAVSLAVALTVPNVASAGGLFLSEFGTEDVALAGAGWAARAQDASTLFKNPAGMSRLEGNQFQGGLQALYFQSGGFDGTNTPFGGNGGGNPIGAVPGASGFYVHSLGKDVKVGLGMVGQVSHSRRGRRVAAIQQKDAARQRRAAVRSAADREFVSRALRLSNALKLTLRAMLVVSRSREVSRWCLRMPTEAYGILWGCFSANQ